MPPLYAGHVATTGLQKALLAVGAAVTALSNPYRGDMVAVLSEVTPAVLQQLRARMQQTAEGRDILRERPRISSKSVDLEALRRKPETTFGGAYARFIEKHVRTSTTICCWQQPWC